jgi:hypothetical protein
MYKALLLYTAGYVASIQEASLGIAARLADGQRAELAMSKAAASSPLHSWESQPHPAALLLLRPPLRPPLRQRCVLRFLPSPPIYSNCHQNCAFPVRSQRRTDKMGK